MSDPSWLLYGATGYTGALIAEAALARGVRPILGGRREDAVRPLAERLALPWRAFALDDAAACARGLADVRAVLSCAGPFSTTFAPLVEACLRAGVHYLDVTGEVDVFEAILARDHEAKARGVVLLPGVGFDVVPSDCLARALADALPEAITLELAFAAGAVISRGTARTMLQMLPKGGVVRRDGVLRRVPLAATRRTVAFADRERAVACLPLGDVATAYRSTGIPNITTYIAARPVTALGLRALNPFAALLGAPPVQRALAARVAAGPDGPDAGVRARRRVQLWGRVADATGRSRSGTMTTPEAYAFTSTCALAAAVRVTEGEVAPGAHTPATAFGAGFAASLGAVMTIGSSSGG